MSPSFLEALNARTWTLDALCTQPPHNALSWVYGKVQTEPAPSVVKRFEVCARCPVMTECLADVISAREYAYPGVYGGTTTLERAQALDTLRDQLPGLAEHEIRQSAAVVLISTFDARLTMWKQRAAGRTPMALLTEPERAWCHLCGQGWLWADPQGRCTRWCRKVERREQRALVAA